METNGRNLPETVLLSIRHRKARKAKATPRKRIEGAEMVVASYNVHKCIGVDRKFDPERTARVIREISPDVIALQEADNRFGDRAGLLDLNRLEIETGLVPVPVSGPALLARIETKRIAPLLYRWNARKESPRSPRTSPRRPSGPCSTRRTCESCSSAP